MSSLHGEKQTTKQLYLPDKPQQSIISPFSIKLKPQDIEKRITISILQFNQKEKEYIKIGSMSFGILNIIKNNNIINGWYYLLEKSLGHMKHMKVAGNQYRGV